MSLVNITNLVIDNPQDLFLSTIKISITFEVLQQLASELEWKLIYIGSSKDERFDQVLDQFSIGPLQQGVMQFTMESNPPNFQLIPSKEDLIGVTAMILSVSYLKKEFFRCGYYVYNNYANPELIENDPPQIIIEQIYRHIYAEKPRVTRFNITWDNQQTYCQPEAQTNHSFMFNGQQQQPLTDMTNQHQQQQQIQQLPQQGYAYPQQQEIKQQNNYQQQQFMQEQQVSGNLQNIF